MIQRTINDIMDEYYKEEYLVDITYRNIIETRREELLRIMAGEKAVKVIPTSNQRSKLKRDNVLSVVYRQGGKCIVVSDKARRLLEESK